MIAYHGSNSNFRNFRISKSLVKHKSTELNEGLGIYFSTDRSVAASYGKYLYTININNNNILNFRQKRVCLSYISNIRKYILTQTGVDIYNYFNYTDIQSLADYMVCGSIAISGTCREIQLLLDSNFKWYLLPKTQIAKVYSILNSYDKKNLKAYLFNYHIKGIGVIKQVDDSVVQIVNKERI